MDGAVAEIPVAIREPKRHSLLVELVIRLLREKPLGTVGAVIVLLLFLTAVLADFLAPYGFNEMILADRLDAPSAKHLLGADNMGRDMLSRIVYGARISVFVGLGATILDTLVAVIIGLISGFFGGKIDTTIQRFVDAWICLPNLFLYLTVMAILGPGLIQVILVLGIASGIGSSRVIRSAVIGIRGNVYVEAARAIGAPARTILLRHILPNVSAPIIIIFSISVGGMILAEASLSFLGFGIPPPVPSWGGMISGTGREFMLQAPWMMIWPGLALSLVVYGMNMLGDAMRDLLDPRLRGGLGRYAGVKVSGSAVVSQAKK